MKIKFAVVIAVLLLSTSLSACCGIFGDDGNFSVPAIQGTITDVETGKGIPDVIVISKLGGSVKHGWGDNHRNVCLRLDLTTTDSTGRYSFSARELRNIAVLGDNDSWSQRWSGVSGIYKSGYSSYVRFLHPEVGGSRTELTTAPIRTISEHFETRQFLNNLLSCITDKDSSLSEENMRLLIKTMRDARQDAMRFEATPERQMLLDEYDADIVLLLEKISK